MIVQKSRTSRRVSSVAVVMTMLIAASCGTARSPEAFCDTLRSEKERILSQLESRQDAAASSGDPLLEMFVLTGATFEAFGELRTYTRKLAEVAPEEIRVEAELVAEGVSAQLDAQTTAASDPLGALFSGLVGGLSYAGPLNSLNSYALNTCGEGI